MAEKPASVPTWATTGGTTTEPLAPFKAQGWQAGHKGPAKYFNWLFNLIYQWILYLETPVGTGAGAGFSATGGATNGAGLQGTGGGTTGIGVRGVGASQGHGVKGEAAHTSGNGGYFINTDGNGCFCEGAGATYYGVKGKNLTGYGVIAEGDTTTPAYPPLRIVPTDAEPTAHVAGSVYVGPNGILHWANGTKYYGYNEYDTVPDDDADLLSRNAQNCVLAKGEFTTSGAGGNYGAHHWNIASIARNAVGDFTVTFDRALDMTSAVNITASLGLTYAYVVVANYLWVNTTSVRILLYKHNTTSHDFEAHDGADFSLTVIGKPSNVV